MMMMMICPRANIYVVTRCSDYPESAVRYTRDLGMQSLDMKHIQNPPSVILVI